MKKALLTIFTVLVLDQLLKIWVKLNFHYGESQTIIPGWLDLQFVENRGMAFGWMIPGDAGKLTLSIFRLVVVTGIAWYLYRLIKEKAHWGYVVCVSLIVAGAMGNIVDSLAYGLMFDRGSTYDPDFNDYTMYFGKAELNYEGYAKPLMGNVVDMFHFTARWPWGDSRTEIFPPIFNIADASITVGIILIMLFQRRFFPKKEERSESDQIDTVANDTKSEAAELNTEL